jgi:hypothetical protein
MPENPYEPPKEAEPTAPPKWGRRFLWSVMVVAAAATTIMLFAGFGPVEFGPEELRIQDTPVNRVLFTIFRIAQWTFWAGVLGALVFGIAWAVTLIRARKPSAS